jgi:hypothetical protein
MSRKRSALRDATPAHRVHAAERQEADYRAFLDLHALDNDPDSLVLFLTSLLQQPEATGKGLRRALAQLDLAAAMTGEAPPSSLLQVRLFLRGAHRLAPLGPPVQRCDPLYREQVRLLVDQALRPTARQLRDIACVLIVNSTGVRYPQIRDLRWRDIRLYKHRAEVTLTPAHDDARRFTLPVDADTRVSAPHVLRALRQIDGPSDGPVLAQRGDRAGSMRYHRLLAAIGATDLKRHTVGRRWATPQQLLRAVTPLWAPSTSSLRDRALITIAFLGALTNIEAANLLVGDVTVTPAGLLVNLPCRPAQRVGLPRGLDARFCPVRAWTEWLDRYQPGALAPAFPRLRPMGSRISHDALTETGLSEVVKQHAASAGFDGLYTFSSLRLGFIRTAIRNDVPAPLIAQHAGLRQLKTIEIERAREHVLTDGAVTRIGL